MAFDKSRFIEYVKEDAELIKKLKKHNKEFHYAKNRTGRHSRLRNLLVEALQKQPKDKAEEKALLDDLQQIEKKRSEYRRQTQFLLLADYIEDMAKVQEFFPPPPDAEQPS